MMLVFYLLISLGLCYSWSDTEASRPLRNLVARIPYIRTPLLCHECSSFWISLLLTLFINPLENYTKPIVSNILSAFMGFFINLYFVRKNIIPLKD
jgi:hypothetical protein